MDQLTFFQIWLLLSQSSELGGYWFVHGDMSAVTNKRISVNTDLSVKGTFSF